MDIVNLFPSLPQFFQIALSLFNSTFVANNRRAICESNTMIDFDVDIETGFFPRQPLPRLQKPFDIWETALAEAPEILSLGEDSSDGAVEKRRGGEMWRQRVKLVSTRSFTAKLVLTIKQWPTVDVELLQGDYRRLQRAHMVLAWLVNFFVHSIPPSEEATHVPQSLAVPLVKVSRVIGIAPILTFADTVLWNWELVDPELPARLENMRIANLFSGTDDERNFYAISVRAELEGVEILHILESYHSLPNTTDLASISRISRDLLRLADIIDYISDIIQSVRETCDPHVFFHDIRPWLEGSDMKGPAGRRWIYEGVTDSGMLDLSGPSGGQSSVMHALDVFLDVDHKLQNKRFPAPSESNKKADRGFMERMTRYMPGKHREYLSRLAATPRPIRDLALKSPTLREPYNTAVMALKRLRDTHMRIACRYIVMMARRSTTAPSSCPVSAMMGRLEARGASVGGAVRGTGGNEVSMLLKAGRDATRRTLLGEHCKL